MNATSQPPAKRRLARRFGFWGLLATPLLLLALLAAGVANCFRLTSDARALRNELVKSSGIEWRQQIALNANALTLGAVRAGLHCVRLDPGARAALKSVRSAAVGVYQLPVGTPPPDRPAMLAAADATMTARGWERAVGVMDGHDLVAIYLSKEVSVHRLKCCVMVFDRRKMVLVSAQGKPEPLLQYALNKQCVGARIRQLAER